MESMEIRCFIIPDLGYTRFQLTKLSKKYQKPVMGYLYAGMSHFRASAKANSGSENSDWAFTW
jgi:hypothetical protein